MVPRDSAQHELDDDGWCVTVLDFRPEPEEPVDLSDVPPCLCCGEAHESQLEYADESNGGLPWPYCAGCDPALDELGGEWICECRVARGDANWETLGGGLA